jgi:preprotein translocase subunit SecD
MFGTLKGRLVVIAIVLLVAVGAMVANVTRGEPAIKLGLDLQGGMHLALEVDDPDNSLTAEAREAAVDQNLEVLRNRVDQFGVTEPLIQKVGSERIIVELAGVTDEERARNVIEQAAFLEWKLVLPTMEFVGDVLNRMDRAILRAGGDSLFGAAPSDTALGALGGRPDSTRQALTEALFGRRPDSTAAVDSAAADTTTAAPTRRPFGDLLLDSGRDGEFLIAEENVERAKRLLALPGVLDVLPRNTELRWGKPEGQGAQLYRSLYFLQERAFINGERLRGATAGRDPQYNKTVVTFELDRRGGRTFDEVTSQHIGDRIAIVLDTIVQSAPEVISRIGANGQIDMGQAPMEEASDLALVLRAGALTQPLTIVEQRSVGPSLGQDSIDQGAIAGLVGVLLVMIIMIYYYRLAGALAVSALIIYTILVMGGLAGIGATLTAPGIAGFILSLGMAVDANVLIFERTREELAAGRSIRVAVDEGFKHAMSAIIDSNITTLITAAILRQVGTGPVQGFATTLIIGIIASFFSAVYVTRTFFLIYLERRRAGEPISI